MSAVLLDTCALMCLAGGKRLRPAAMEAVLAAADEAACYVSAVTAWELGCLYERGRLRLVQAGATPEAWFADLVARPGFATVPLTPEVALASTRLPHLKHRDPADRFLLATARHMAIPIVTSDRVMLAYAEAGHVQCIPC